MKSHQFYQKLREINLFTDAGKSTIGGQIMYLTGMVDKRTLEKYEREAKEKNRETWYLSWCMDTNAEGTTKKGPLFQFHVIYYVLYFQNAIKAKLSKWEEAFSKQKRNILQFSMLRVTNRSYRI